MDVLQKQIAPLAYGMLVDTYDVMIQFNLDRH